MSVGSSLRAVGVAGSPVDIKQMGMSRIFSLPSPPEATSAPCTALPFPESCSTFRDSQHNLTEGPAAQLVLGEDAELVGGVGLQTPH